MLGFLTLYTSCFIAPSLRVPVSHIGFCHAAGLRTAGGIEPNSSSPDRQQYKTPEEECTEETTANKDT